MSDSNRIRVSIIPEVTFGVTPTSTPAFLTLATTGVSLRDRIGYQQSQTINNDRNVLDVIRLSKAAGGGVPMELTYSPTGEGLMSLIKAALAGTEDAEVEEVTGVLLGSTITDSGADFVNDGVEIGDIIRTAGAALAADNGYRRVTAVAATVLTCSEAFTGTDTGVTVTRGPRIKNGTTETTFSIEVAHLDIDKAQIFTGCVIDTMDFTVADESITTTNFTIQAAGSTFVDAPVTGTGDTAVFMTGATYAPPSVHPVIDSIGIPEIRSGGAAYAAKSINMGFSNNASPRTQIGSLGAQSMRFGEFGATGRVTAYLEDFTELQAYAGNTSSDIWFAAIDENGKGYSMSLPKVKWSDAGADVTGSNTDVLVDLAATAVKDEVELITVRFQRWD
tara:strand:- start:414 stop:1586 length:1173 start_codon:yes stop_codon:yes gene_type:complete